MQSPILEALNWRYATKIFDPTKKVSAENLHVILESARLAPSSIGIEPWKFIVVENTELRSKLRAAAYDQPKVTDASQIIVVAYRTDVRDRIANELVERTASIQRISQESLVGLRQMAEGSIARRSDAELTSWIRAQSYIALGMMIQTASLLNIDNCPMEGFANRQVDTILNLSEQHLASTSMLAIGYRGEDPAAKRPKVRRAFEDVVDIRV